MTTFPTDNAKWIEDGKLPRTTSDFKVSGYTIGHCIPPTFDSYCKIFHPFEINKSETENLELAPDFFKRRQEYKLKHWDFISWHEVADKYSLSFHKEINPETFAAKFKKIGWPNNLSFPSEGYLPRQLLVKLLNILNTVTPDKGMFIYQMPPNNIWKDKKDSDLVKCTSDEVLEYFNEDFIGYLYSSDKSWIVFTDTDLHYTVVGGQQLLINKLLDSDLEVLSCDRSTRVDYHSDSLNK